MKNAIMKSVSDWSKPLVLMVRRLLVVWSADGLQIFCVVSL